ncbi:MAG: electron transfer flavoprotein subunit alpha [Planctomycetota bacterium]|jgi:electron transfer flavoprotein alpha subunit|nr:electron transfer flavoprotein subunit alpha [Planctomycetota bacterium]
MSDNALLINPKKCVGCRVCVKTCPFGALEMDGKLAVVNVNCTFCGACAPSCKFDAISLVKAEKEAAVNLADYKGVWVFGEQIDGVVQGVVHELIGKGRELADKLGVPLSVLVLGHDMDEQCRELLEYPVDRVIQVDDPELRHYASEPYAQVVSGLIAGRKPEIFLAGATAIGRSFLARVAVAVRTGLTADCTGLDITDDRLLLQTRPAFGGNIMASILCAKHRPQMSTVRHKVMQAAEKDGGRGGKVEKLGAEGKLPASRTRRLDWLPELSETVNLVEADIIVSGGRGLGRPESFRMLEKLAKLLGGAVGSSRAAVDSGWMPYSHQVGQTGKTVQPKLYIACGISGAVQHLVGMQSSDRIIAINKDRDAPIFGVATYGFVGDVFEVVPAMIRELGGEA